MDCMPSRSSTLTFVTSEAQGDLHVFVPESLPVENVCIIAKNLSIRVEQAVHVFHDRQRSQYRLCPVQSGSMPLTDVYGDLWYCYDHSASRAWEMMDETSETEDAGHELLQQATPPQKIPRPRNSWILYRQAKSKIITKDQPGSTAAQISTIIAGLWRNEPPEVKAHWQDLAKKEEQLHAETYPGYRYSARKKSQNT